MSVPWSVVLERFYCSWLAIQCWAFPKQVWMHIYVCIYMYVSMFFVAVYYSKKSTLIGMSVSDSQVVSNRLRGTGGVCMACVWG